MFKEVKRLNAAYRAQVTHPKGPHEILLPVQNVATFKANLHAAAVNAQAQAEKTKVVSKKVKVVQTMAGQYHTVNKGDTLHLIATKYGTTVAAIKNKNKLNSDIIRSGTEASDLIDLFPKLASLERSLMLQSYTHAY